MHALVTGGTGFLGSRLARRLHEAGARVRVLARKTSSTRRLAGVTFETAIGDVTDRESVVRALDGIDAVFHCAALYELGTRRPTEMEAINVEGTRNVLEAARGRLAVHVSSTAALGPTGDAACDESHWNPAEPRSPYEATKRRAHEIARALGVRIAVPVTIYGPDDPSLVGRAHEAFLRGLVPLGAREKVKMSFVHVDDCADGVARIAERGADREEYILSADVVTFREWFETLAAASGRKPPRAWIPDALLEAARPGATLLAPLVGVPRALVREGYAMSSGVSWAFSGDKARRTLGWSPRSLRAGLEDVVAFHREGHPHA